MPWPETHRARICQACQWPCPARGTLDLASPATVCPRGQWRAWQEPAPAPRQPAGVPSTISRSTTSASSTISRARLVRITPSPIEQLGPKLWAELHRRPWACDLATEAAWIRDTFTPRLTACACRKDWLAALHTTPPDLASPAAYFAWSVARHNEVNARLGKPRLTLAEAMAIWHPASPSPATGLRPA